MMTKNKLLNAIENILFKIIEKLGVDYDVLDIADVPTYEPPQVILASDKPEVFGLAVMLATAQIRRSGYDAGCPQVPMDLKHSGASYFIVGMAQAFEEVAR